MQRRLKIRAEFLAVQATRQKWVRPTVIIEVRRQPQGGLRYGLTASRKVGNAVKRNRARRRLRALAERLLPSLGNVSADLVFVARPSTASAQFTTLEQDCLLALRKLGFVSNKG